MGHRGDSFVSRGQESEVGATPPVVPLHESYTYTFAPLTYIPHPADYPRICNILRKYADYFRKEEYDGEILKITTQEDIDDMPVEESALKKRKFAAVVADLQKNP